MVRALKGSRMFLKARPAFSLGVRGLTSGPLTNRWKKLSEDGGGEQGGGRFELVAGAVPESGVAPARDLAADAAETVINAPADSDLVTTRQGLLDPSSVTSGKGASGREAAGFASSA